MFLLGAVILAINSGIVLYDVLEGTELRLPLGQVFVGAGWTAALVGMLGLYPELADQRPWLARACGFFAAVGVYGYAAMTVAFAAAVAGTPTSTLESIQVVFFPAMVVGTFVAFPLFAIVTLLAGTRSPVVSLLLGAPTAIFVANAATGPTADSIFGVLVALVVVFGTIGYLLRNDAGSGVTTSSSSEASA